MSVSVITEACENTMLVRSVVEEALVNAGFIWSSSRMSDEERHCAEILGAFRGYDVKVVIEVCEQDPFFGQQFDMFTDPISIHEAFAGP